MNDVELKNTFIYSLITTHDVYATKQVHETAVHGRCNNQTTSK
jgi:hypothetical protein